jgi:hypothetical protein
MRMRRYFYLFAVPFAAALVTLSALLVLNLRVTVQSNYWETESYKRKLALVPIDGQKLVVVAGSNAYFGIQAGALEKSTGIRAINLAVQGALSFDFMTALIKNLLVTGDIVLLPLEYTFYSETHHAIRDRTNTLQASVAWSLYPAYLWSLPATEWLSFIRHLSYGRLWEGVRSRLDPPRDISVYRVEGLNEWGDNTIDYRNAATRTLLDYNVHEEQARGLPQFDPDSRRLRDIERFIAWAKNHGVMLLAAFPNTMDVPPFRGPQLASLREDIQRFWAGHRVAFVDDPAAATVSPEMILDTPYHPTLEGSQLRTARLIRRLCATIPICHA